MDATIRRLVDADIEVVVSLSLAAWAPVFAGIEMEMGPEVFRLVYPDWRAAQASAVEAVCRSSDTDVWVAAVDGRPVGFVAIRLGQEDAASVGEIDMLAVDPAHQRGGVGTSLVDRAVAELRSAGVDLAVVATGGDPGHAPARALYERSGFNGFRQVRYYRKL